MAGPPLKTTDLAEPADDGAAYTGHSTDEGSRTDSPSPPGTPGVVATAASLKKNMSFSSLKKSALDVHLAARGPPR